jgi:hypothetical protein
MAHLASEKGTTGFLASILFAAAFALVALPAFAQGRPPHGASCPSDRKFAAGACVATCPGGSSGARAAAVGDCPYALRALVRAEVESPHVRRRIASRSVA